MKAMILAAGQGKRLRPITDNIPKPMVKAGGLSLIEWHIKKLKAVGITDIVVNGAWKQEVLFDFLGHGEKFGVNITQSPEEGEGLETAGGIIKALPYLGDEPFLVINGDIFVGTDYKTFLPCPSHLQGKDPRFLAELYLTRNPKHNLKGDYALSHFHNLEYGSDYTFAGIAWYNPIAFADKPVQREPLRPYFDEWVKERKVKGTVLQCPWFDVGTVERLAELEQYLNTQQTHENTAN